MIKILQAFWDQVIIYNYICLSILPPDNNKSTIFALFLIGKRIENKSTIFPIAESNLNHLTWFSRLCWEFILKPGTLILGKIQTWCCVTTYTNLQARHQFIRVTAKYSPMTRHLLFDYCSRLSILLIYSRLNPNMKPRRHTSKKR